MSKKKKSKGNTAPAPPAFMPSQIYNGDQLVGETAMQNGKLVTKYFPNPAQQQRQQLAEQQINQLLPTLGKTAPELASQYDQMQNDYINSQTDAFTKQYNKTLNGLREDITSRFGTTNATPYYDKLTQMQQDVYNPAITEINREGSMFRQDLGNKDEARKLQELSALGYTLSGDQQAFLNNLTTPLNSSQMAHNFNQNNYMQQLQQYNANMAAKQNSTNNFLGFLGRAF